MNVREGYMEIREEARRGRPGLPLTTHRHGDFAAVVEFIDAFEDDDVAGVKAFLNLDGSALGCTHVYTTKGDETLGFLLCGSAASYSVTTLTKVDCWALR